MEQHQEDEFEITPSTDEESEPVTNTITSNTITSNEEEIPPPPDGRKKPRTKKQFIQNVTARTKANISNAKVRERAKKYKDLKTQLKRATTAVKKVKKSKPKPARVVVDDSTSSSSEEEIIVRKKKTKKKEYVVESDEDDQYEDEAQYENVAPKLTRQVAYIPDIDNYNLYKDCF